MFSDPLFRSTIQLYTSIHVVFRWQTSHTLTNDSLILHKGTQVWRMAYKYKYEYKSGCTQQVFSIDLLKKEIPALNNPQTLYSSRCSCSQLLLMTKKQRKLLCDSHGKGVNVDFAFTS